MELNIPSYRLEQARNNVQAPGMEKASLHKLRSLLGPDDDASAAAYCELHGRISRFFEWNNVEDPRALADEVMEKVSRRAIESGTKESIRNISVFALGVARLLLLEEFRRQKDRLTRIIGGQNSDQVRPPMPKHWMRLSNTALNFWSQTAAG